MEFKLPAGANVSVEGSNLVVDMGGEIQKIPFNSRKIKVEVKGGMLEIAPLNKIRRETNAMVHSVWKHLQNIFTGQGAPFQKKLQVVYAHFPISLEVKGSKVSIKNFLGEKRPREADIVGKAQVAVAGQEITVKGTNKDAVGQTVANIIQSVKITGKDRRVFQDGIYLVR